MIFQGSRYTSSDVVESVDASNRVTRTLQTRTIEPAPSALDHVVADGDRLDTLAARFYGDATRSWLLLDANPETLNPFELLVPGRTIQVPNNRLVGE